MTKTISARYTSPATITNVYDDLVSTGIPREKIHAEPEQLLIKVISPDSTAPEIVEILRRHRPSVIEE